MCHCQKPGSLSTVKVFTFFSGYQDKLEDHCQSQHHPQHWMPLLVVQLWRVWFVQVLLLHELEHAQAARWTHSSCQTHSQDTARGRKRGNSVHRCCSHHQAFVVSMWLLITAILQALTWDERVREGYVNRHQRAIRFRKKKRNKPENYLDMGLATKVIGSLIL